VDSNSCPCAVHSNEIHWHIEYLGGLAMNYCNFAWSPFKSTASTYATSKKLYHLAYYASIPSITHANKTSNILTLMTINNKISINCL